MKRIAKWIVIVAILVAGQQAYTWASAEAGSMSYGTQADVDYGGLQVREVATWLFQEDEIGWDCATMGDGKCGHARPYPVKITGHFLTGWRITMSDGTHKGGAPWSKIKAECRHDENQMACITAWYIIYSNYGEERAMIRGLR